MWSFITSLFSDRNTSDDLTLESACSLLESSGTTTKEHFTKDISRNAIENTLLTNTGTITAILVDKIIIDNLYICDKNVVSCNFNVGNKVLFDTLCSDGNRRILKISLVDNEWDLGENKNQLWNNRIVVCKVESRIGRKLYLSPGDIEVDLDKDSIEFLPIIGDWLELDVKCTVDENSVGLFGSIVEINKILPVRPHVVSGTVSSWNDETGVINKNIFYNKSSLLCGYNPVAGDKVTVQVIESEQNRCCWRALQVNPENFKNRTGNIFHQNINTTDIINEHPGVAITGLNIVFENLNVTKYFFITVSNKSDKILILKEIDIFNNNSQCKILSQISDISIEVGSEYKIHCQCTSKNIGVSKDFLLLSINEFKIGQWLIINVILKNNTGHIENRNYNHNSMAKGRNDISKNQVIRGQRANKPRFEAVRIPAYDLPQKLYTFICQYDQNESAIIQEELKVIKPVLFSNLNYTNYEDKFHTLLHLDEIANLISIRSYDQDKACFIANNEFLMLEIEKLSERRPSIILGDKIIATDSMNERGLDYEGIVHKVGAKHIYLKFSPLFHDQYNGEDYSIRVVPGRQAYRKLHHAIYLAVRNLGGDILFPTKLITKDPQLKIDVDISSTQKDEHKNDLSIGNEVKLEWYNKNLNAPQQNAVINVLTGKARPLPYIIFGPPGTGKTVTLIEIILQITRCLPQSRLLITAPSNSAADLIALRLIDSGVLKPGDLVRLISYNYAMSESVPVRLVPYCATGNSSREGTIRSEMSENAISFDCSRTTIGRHRITVSTCTAAGQLFLMGFPKGHFSHIIVDEAAQAAEPDVMIPISFLDKTTGQVILAGDQLQLGPVVLCRIAAQCGLGESYLERLINRFPYVKDSEGFPDTLGYDPKLVTKLVYSYRALPDILGLYSSLFYHNELIATIDDEHSTEAELLKKIEGILPVTKCGKVSRMVFHGVNGENYQGEDSPSWCNPHEAAQLFYYINELYRLGMKNENIGIITPYIKQVKEIRSLLTEAEFDIPKIGTVEEFQGQEFDVILVSTVRSCQEFVPFDVTHSLGFVASPKRLNVAISRAKSLLIIIGNPTLLCQDVHWRSVVKYCIDKGCYIGCEIAT